MSSKFQFVPWIVSRLSGRKIIQRYPLPLTKNQTFVQNSYFSDSFQHEGLNVENLKAIEIYQLFAAKTPAWVNHALRMRNFVVSKFGLKDVGTFADLANSGKPIVTYKKGDRLTIFTVVDVDDNEITLEDNDHHLQVQVTLRKESPTSVSITTAVQVHNFWGKLYMFFVAHPHKWVAASGLASLRTP